MRHGTSLARAVGALTVLAGGGSALAGLTFENTINTFGIIKTGHYVQVNAGTVGTQSYDFFAGATEQNPADHLVQLMDFRHANMDGTPNSQGMADVGGAWEFDDSAMYGNEGSLSFEYPSTNDYTFAVTVDGMGVFEEPIDGPNDLYPDVVPKVNNFAALQMADPNADITIQFAGFGNIGGLNLVKATVTDGIGSVWGDQGVNTDTSLTIPGGTLDPNASYDLYLRYETFQNYNDRTFVFPDSLAAFTFRYETKVSLITIPAPGAGAMLMLGAASARRRRRR
jgi:hypothetical protein